MIELKVEGMSCQHCVKAVEDTLTQTFDRLGRSEEVVKIQVFLAEGRATVELRPTESTVAEVNQHLIAHLTDALTEEGYQANVLV